MYDVAIIGAGITGCSAAYELGRYDIKVAVIEKENDVAQEATKANSAIIHAGYDPEPGTLMAKHNVRGNAMAKELCERLDVPYTSVRSLVLAFTEDEMEKVRVLYDRGIENGVPRLEIISGDRVRELEPNLSGEIRGALLAPSSGIVLPWEYAIALSEVALENGTDFFLSSQITSIEKNQGGFNINTSNKDNPVIRAKYIINAAGCYADRIHEMVGGSGFTIKPSKGTYYLLDKAQGPLVHSVCFQCPTKAGKGVVVAPTVHGNILAGPDALETEDMDNKGTPKESLDYVAKMARKTTDKINFRDNIRNFAGIRANSDQKDFVIGESPYCNGFINLACIKSPGLSAAPSIALEAVDILKGLGLKLKEKDNPVTTRKKMVVKNLSHEEISSAIKENPLYGRVICRCETITEGEIVDALKSSLCPSSIDGVKRRAGTGMGRCQGGFCSPRVASIIARERHIPLEQVLQDSEGSEILVEETKKGGTTYEI